MSVRVDISLLRGLLDACNEAELDLKTEPLVIVNTDILRALVSSIRKLRTENKDLLRRIDILRNSVEQYAKTLRLLNATQEKETEDGKASEGSSG